MDKRKKEKIITEIFTNADYGPDYLYDAWSDSWNFILDIDEAMRNGMDQEELLNWLDSFISHWAEFEMSIARERSFQFGKENPNKWLLPKI